MPGTTPTGRDLYDRLSELLGTETAEDLAHALGMSVRVVQRLKAGFGPNQELLLGLLDVAGWLNTNTRMGAAEARERAKMYGQFRRRERRARRDGRQ